VNYTVLVEQTKTLWAELNVPLYKVEVTSLDDRSREYLRTVGFPEEAEPGLDFTDLTGNLFTHTQLYTRDDFPALDQYLVIGATGDGNPVCIDSVGSSVVYIDHDNGFEAVFINSDLPSFNYCMAQYSRTCRAEGGLTLPGIKALELEIQKTDPRAIEESTFWTDAILQLERIIE